MFDYLYRDAGNYKAHGRLPLLGGFTEDDMALIERSCEDGRLFIAEQIGVPTLYHQLYEFSGGPTCDDLAFHEVWRFREAEPGDLLMTPWGTVAELVDRFRQVGGEWKLGLSPHSGPAFW